MVRFACYATYASILTGFAVSMQGNLGNYYSDNSTSTRGFGVYLALVASGMLRNNVGDVYSGFHMVVSRLPCVECGRLAFNPFHRCLRMFTGDAYSVYATR